MSIFNEKLTEALFTGEYICKECGQRMEFEDEWRSGLVCVHCGYSVELDDYGKDDADEAILETSSDEEVPDEPECCRACGGPYPDCTTSCKIFDE